MRAVSCVLLGLVMGAVNGLPTFSVEKRQSLITIAPEISPTIGGGTNNCFGIGISVCDPINVEDGDDDEESGKPKGNQQQNTPEAESGALPLPKPEKPSLADKELAKVHEATDKLVGKTKGKLVELDPQIGASQA